MIIRHSVLILLLLFYLQLLLSSASENSFVCDEGKTVIPLSRVDDDYCDCLDGSDEQHTSACRNGKFLCVNKGYHELYIPSSRVGDGICDCCDGSDENGFGRTVCKDECWELGQEWRLEMQKLAETQKSGAKIRRKWSEEYKLEKRKRKAEYDELVPKVEVALKLKERLAAEKEQLDEVERKEKDDLRDTLQKEKEAEDKKEDNSRNKEEGEAVLVVEEEEEAKEDKEEVDDENEENLEVENLDDSEDLEDLEEEKRKQENREIEDAVDQHVNEEDEDDEMGESQFRDEVFVPRKRPRIPKYRTSGGSFRKKVLNPSINVWRSVQDYVAPLPSVRRSEAQRIREEFNNAESEYNTLSSREQELRSFLEKDFGVDGAFYVLDGECFSIKDKDYSYELCPFDSVKQKESGGRSNDLGKFEKWENDVDSSALQCSAQLYSNGAKCWNGPNRSTNVKIACGPDNVVVKVSEPAKCTYEMLFETPAACFEDVERHILDNDEDQQRETFV